jgi:GNAT superfamily N-acetyltransferase
MYARVLANGDVRPGDRIEMLPPHPDSGADVHRELDLLDSVEREAWLAMWRAAAEAGYDVRILDRGEGAAAASPELPGSIFNRAFGMRQVPILRRRMEALFDGAGGPGWLVVGLDDPTFAGATLDWPVGIHSGSVVHALQHAERVRRPSDETPVIRRVDPDDGADVNRWTELFVEGFGVDGAVADAWRRFNPILVRARGYQQFIAAVGGRDVAVSAMFNRRRVTWLGAGTVLPEARGRGIQRALIADRIRRGEAAGSTRVFSTAELDTASAANLATLGLPRIWSRGHFRVGTMPG